MASSVVLVDRDPLYAWFVTEALLAADTAVTWFRDAASAMAQAPQMPEPALLLADGLTWLTDSRGGASAAADTWPRAVLIGWDSRTVPPAGFATLDAKPADAGYLQALVAEAQASAVAAGAAAAAAAAAPVTVTERPPT
jgi:hypothetical protein